MLNVEQFRELVVMPTLISLDMWSQAAEDLMVGTAMQESKLTYLSQYNNGPAKGVYQIELGTAKDILRRYMDLRPDLERRLFYATDRIGDLDALTDEDIMELILVDLRFATAVARLKYYMVPKALPKSGDIEGYAKYWKKYYNTHLGAGTEEEFIYNYKKYVL